MESFFTVTNCDERRLPRRRFRVNCVKLFTTTFPQNFCEKLDFNKIYLKVALNDTRATVYLHRINDEYLNLYDENLIFFVNCKPILPLLKVALTTSEQPLVCLE